MILKSLNKKLDFTPKDNLELAFSCEIDDLKELKTYLSNNLFEKMYIEVWLYYFENSTFQKFEELTDIIFDYLDVNYLEVWFLDHDITSSNLYDKVRHCKSLRTVKFIQLNNPDAQLEIINSNSNIKQTELEFRKCDITESIVEKVDELLSQRNDNSVFIYYDEKFKNVSKISQIFNISKISD